MANAVYQKAGTAVRWTDTTGDLAITLNNLAAGAGRQGAQKDWGALSTARPTRYRFRANVRFNAAPTVGQSVQIFWKSGDGTIYDNDDGTGDAALSSTNKLFNLKLIGTIAVDEAATGVDMSISGEFEDLERYGIPVVFNNTGVALVASNNVSFVDVQPIFDEVQ